MSNIQQASKATQAAPGLQRQKNTSRGLVSDYPTNHPLSRPVPNIPIDQRLKDTIFDRWCQSKNREIDRMRPLRAILSVFPILRFSLAYGQEAAKKGTQTPIETNVCKIADDPSAYNNKLVKVRGYVSGNFEYSILVDERRPENGIWFSFADGSGPPWLTITVSGKGIPGGRDSKGRATAPVSVRLIRDSNFEELKHFWAISTKGEACADGPPPASPPDCTTYRVIATFIGRVDGVSHEVHAAHLKRSSRDPVDGRGFGQMGMFDAQIVVQSVETVVAEDESVIRKPQSKSQ